jgi:acyl carrier protein
MNHQAHPLTTYTVRVAIARFRGVPTPNVDLRHVFDRDLGMDAFDLALVAFEIAEALGVDIALRGVDEKDTVGALADRVEDALLVDEIRTATVRRRGAA